MFEKYRQPRQSPPPKAGPPVGRDDLRVALQPTQSSPITDPAWYRQVMRDPFLASPPPGSLPASGEPLDPYGPPEPLSGRVCHCNRPWHVWESIYDSIACAACQWPRSLPLVRRFLVVGPAEWGEGGEWRPPAPGQPTVMREDPRVLRLFREQFNRRYQRRRAAEAEEVASGY